MVKLLVDHGAYIDAKDHYGRNALDWALINGHHDIFNILISKRDKGFWKHFLSGCETIYESMERIIPERFLKIFWVLMIFGKISAYIKGWNKNFSWINSSSLIHFNFNFTAYLYKFLWKYISAQSQQTDYSGNISVSGASLILV